MKASQGIFSAHRTLTTHLFIFGGSSVGSSMDVMFGSKLIQTRALSTGSGEEREKPSAVADQKMANNAPAPNVNSVGMESSLLSYSYNIAGLFDLAVTPEKLVEAWYQLKSNPGMMTPGPDLETLDKISKHWFETTSKKLTDGTFKYPPAKRIDIPKAPGKTGTRPLTISPPRIKIIERALLNALEPIFEGAYRKVEIPPELLPSPKELTLPENYTSTVKKGVKTWYKKTVYLDTIFHPTSFGFRPEKSAHMALHRIKTQWRSSTVYMLDYDIKKAFDTVNKNRLKNCFNKYVVDRRFFAEIDKMLNAGYLQDDVFTVGELGVNQGSILSPFLFNIYMHDLDIFIDNLNKQHAGSNKHSEEPGYGDAEARKSYRAITTKYSDNMLKTLKKLGSKEKFLEAKNHDRRAHFKKFGRKLGIDKENRYVQYVRYADDFIVGIVGPRSFAVETRSLIDNFIKSTLHMEVSRNEIVHRDQPAVEFLGHNIQLVNFNGKVRTKNAKLNAIKKHKSRVIERLKSQDSRLASATADRAKNIMLSKVDKLTKALNLNLNEKDLDLVGAIIAYDHVGDALAKSVNLKDSRELLNLSLKDTAVSAPDGASAVDRWKTLLEHRFKNQESIASSIFFEQCKRLRGDPNFEVDGVGKKLKALQKEYEEKFESLATETMDELTEDRKRHLLETHTNKQRRKASDLTFTGLSPEDTELLSDLARDLVEEDLRKSSVRVISIRANLSKLIAKLRLSGFVHPEKDKPCSCQKLLRNTEQEIISYYNSIMHGTLNWFSGADNFSRIKSIVESILRVSCSLTLKRKFNMSSIRQVIEIYGRDISLKSDSGSASLVSKDKVAEFPNKFNLKPRSIKDERFEYYNLIDQARFKQHGLSFLNKCSVEGCTNTDIEVHHIKKLHRKINSNGLITVVNRSGKRVSGLAGILTAINRKQLPLCRFHHLEFEKNKYSPLDLAVLNHTLNRNSEFFPIKYPENLESVFKGEPFQYRKKSKENTKDEAKKA